MQLPRVGINVSEYAYFGTALPFADFAHMDAEWHSGRLNWGTDPLPPLVLTKHGYPARLAPNQTAQSLVFTHNGGIYPLGKYQLTWEGSGEVRIKAGAIKISEHDYEVKATNPNGLLLEITKTNPCKPVHGIRLMAPADFGEQFNEAWAENLKMYSVVRHLGWTGCNNPRRMITKWSDRVSRDDMHRQFGVPYEDMIALANKNRHDLWLTIPHLCDDDYLRRLAELIVDCLDEDLRVWVEYSNEVWNGGFKSSQYAAAVLCPKYGTPNAMVAYGRKAADVHKIFESVVCKPRLVKVIAGQAANYGTLLYAIQGMTEGGGTADVAAVAPYFYADTNKLFAAHQAGAVDLPAVFAEMRADIDKRMAGVATILTKISLPLVAYEGGQHLTPSPGTQDRDALFVQLLASINRDPRMGDLYKYYLDKWYAAGGQTMCLLGDVYKSNQYGCWGLQEAYLDNDAVKFKTVQQYFE